MKNVFDRIVIKLGTSVLTNGGLKLDRARMIDLARQIALLMSSGVEVIIVSSGAIAAGRDHLQHPELPSTIASKQLLAAVGQSRLMNVWESLFDIYNIKVGQILLTRADIQDRQRFLNARDTINALLSQNIIPIINENDAVATAEIKVGDNDNLSALVAMLAEAEMLALLTDQRGLFTSDPRSNPEAKLIEEVEHIDDSLRSIAQGTVSKLSVGGMRTKLEAADIARRSGTQVVIAAGSHPDVLLHIARAESVGTRFKALNSPLENRKRWIYGGTKPMGLVVIDAGAQKAIIDGGKSLLAAGIIKVEGDFFRGDTISIENTEHKQIGRGISRYSQAEIGKISGLKSEQIIKILGYEYGAAIIHRNDMILT